MRILKRYYFLSDLSPIKFALNSLEEKKMFPKNSERNSFTNKQSHGKKLQRPIFYQYME